MKAIDWIFKDSTTGKVSSTKIIQVVIALGVVALCIIWAVQGQLTFEAGREFVLWLFGIQTTNNLGSRGIKAYTYRTDGTLIVNNTATDAPPDAAGGDDVE